MMNWKDGLRTIIWSPYRRMKWNKLPPAPPLPDEVDAKASAKCCRACHMLKDRKL